MTVDHVVAAVRGCIAGGKSMNVRAMTDLPLAGKRVLIREDLNVPVKNGVVTSDARIVAALPSLERALAAGAAVMVVSHLGRPTEGARRAQRTALQPRAGRQRLANC